MGKLEIQSRKKTNRKNIQKIILGSVAAVGILSVAVLAPSVLGAMAKLGLLPAKRQKEIVKRSRDKLIKRGLLEFKDGFLRLTEQGKAELRWIKVRDFKFEKPKKWDKKWRVLIFDIKEDRKLLREKVRRTLVAMGFARLQDSVWIYPYDCEDLITLLKADFKIGKDVLYMIVDELEYDFSMREKFGLKKD
jgi:CRISPR/Cas system-associated endoribonuclease Cas2